MAQELNCIQTALDGPTGKRWTALPCLSDHIVILSSHFPNLFGAYTGIFGAAIEHDYVEAIMIAVNSTIDCPYCASVSDSVLGHVLPLWPSLT